MGSAISNVVHSVENGVRQIIFEINPSIVKLENSSLTLLDDWEKKLHVNHANNLVSLKESVYIWLGLFFALLLLIVLLIFYLNDSLYRLRFSHFARQCISLFAVTLVIAWMFLASISSIFFDEHVQWFTLKVITFSVFLLGSLFVAFTWFRLISISQKKIKKSTSFTI